uniref:Palmitoyltransferase n=1 Tax=Oncorhynchus kisutch TaxID=8019 RepID=A0A8C7IC47_ONCKI
MTWLSFDGRLWDREVSYLVLVEAPLHLLAQYFMLGNITWNASLFVKTRPSIKGVFLGLEGIAQGWRYETHTPPQCSLCYDSKVCVLRRDHHCVFFGQCVGLRNYHYFLRCLLFMWTGLLYTVVVNTGLHHHHPEGRSHAAQHPATTHALDHAHLWLDWERERGRVYVQRERARENRASERCVCEREREKERVCVSVCVTWSQSISYYSVRKSVTLHLV